MYEKYIKSKEKCSLNQEILLKSQNKDTIAIRNDDMAKNFKCWLIVAGAGGDSYGATDRPVRRFPGQDVDNSIQNELAHHEGDIAYL